MKTNTNQAEEFVMLFTEALRNIFNTLLPDLTGDEFMMCHVTKVTQPSMPEAGCCATVDVTGDHYGSVFVIADEATANNFSRIMHEEDNPSHEDRLDAIGELVNIVGGSGKALMEGENRIDLPVTLGFGAENPVMLPSKADVWQVVSPLGLIVVSTVMHNVTGE